MCNSVTRDGITYIRWIHAIFGTCVYGNREVASYILGYVSIACWLNAQLPQLITNYKNQSADGLSLPFLVNWLLGDITNFLGCILTGQLPFQTYLAAYFCVVDFILFFQYFYYTWFRNQILATEEIPVRPLSAQSLKDSILEGARKSYTFPTRKNQSHKRISSMVFAVLFFTFHSTSSISSSLSTSPHLSTTHDESQSNLSNLFGGHTFFFEYNAMVIGRILAWVCTILYLTSRMPQIWKNHKRKSVEGLSIFMFIFAAFGNLTYTMSILLKGMDAEYLREEVPYIIGSVGTLIFDVTIFIQWYIMRDPDYRKKRSGRRSISYSRDVGYHQLPIDEESYRNERRSRNSQISAGNFV